MAENQTAAEVRAATWHRNGRFVYRNRHGAVGYVDDPESNPGLLAVVRVSGEDAESVAERIHVALTTVNLARDDFPHTVASSRAWMDSAAQFHDNERFYRGIVVQIGEMFGEAARTSDDGTVQDSILALKVPGLVEALIAGGPAVDSQRPGPAEALANIEAFLRGLAKEPYGADGDQLVATAPFHTAENGQQGMITVGDLQAVVRAFRLFPAPLLELTRKRLAVIETAWNSEEQECPDKGQISFLIRLAKAYLDSPTNANPGPALQERTEICKVLGCVDKPGVPLRVIQDLLKRNSQQWARINELLRSWDKANPTERQELDRMRRGWGPSSPTERMRRRDDVLGCLRILSRVLTDLATPEEEAENFSPEAQAMIDAAHDALDKHHADLLAIRNSLDTEPAEWPDIKAAEERGAMAALNLADLPAGTIARMVWQQVYAFGMGCDWDEALTRQSDMALVDNRVKVCREIERDVLVLLMGAQKGDESQPVSASGNPPFRTGDCVIIKETGEPLTVAWADPETGYTSWFGYPPGRCLSSNLELTTPASDQWHRTALLQLKRSGGPVAEKALAYYGDPEVWA